MSTDDRHRPQATEFSRLLNAVASDQKAAAAYLSRAVKRSVTNVQVSRWAGGHVGIPVDIMDAMRAWAKRPPTDTPDLVSDGEVAEVVPLFGYTNAAGSTLNLNYDQRIGVMPIHPAQRGSRQAFAVIVSGDSLSPMLNHGDVAYAIRNRPPRKGHPCLVELATGESYVKIFTGMDERTLFAEQLLPKKDLSWPLRDIAAIHAVVSVTFG